MSVGGGGVMVRSMKREGKGDLLVVTRTHTFPFSTFPFQLTDLFDTLRKPHSFFPPFKCFVRWYYLPTCDDRTIPVLFSIIEVSYISKINYLQTLNCRYIYSKPFVNWKFFILSFTLFRSWIFILLFIQISSAELQNTGDYTIFKDLADKNNSVVLYITTAKSQWDQRDPWSHKYNTGQYTNSNDIRSNIHSTWRLFFFFFKLLQFPKKKKQETRTRI